MTSVNRRWIVAIGILFSDRAIASSTFFSARKYCDFAVALAFFKVGASAIFGTIECIGRWEDNGNDSIYIHRFNE